MNSRERLWNAITGKPVDRTPIWLREGFPLIDGPAEAGHFTNGWQADSLYRQLFQQVAPYADAIEGWGIPGMNRMLMVPPAFIRREIIEHTQERIVYRTSVATAGDELYAIDYHERNVATTWHAKPLVTSLEELRKLAEIPFHVEDEQIQQAIDHYHKTREKTGERGILRLGLSSPIVVISGCMPFELFLELSLTERTFFHRLCEEVTQRILTLLDAVLNSGVRFETTANLGGSEQCTPPMMRPESFREFVVPYDSMIVRRLHDAGIPVNMHCHGKVRYALECMLDMGIDSTDPVEPPPAGDVSIQEARQIVGE
ncbi:MAG: hypothetical protein D6820_14635, partial [Lentisphaerae bacterium]